jgi:hypothetical protein
MGIALAHPTLHSKVGQRPRGLAGRQSLEYLQAFDDRRFQLALRCRLRRRMIRWLGAIDASYTIHDGVSVFEIYHYLKFSGTPSQARLRRLRTTEAAL